MASRTYRNDDIEVYWDSTRCIHTGRCLQGYDSVFDVSHRPWIELDGADVDRVVATVESCPSGALAYHRLDDGPDEVPDSPATVVPWPNGPYFVRGDLEIQDRHGGLFGAGMRATLCRCGASNNQPFCDLSHREVGFRSYPQTVSDDRANAESPRDVSPDRQE